MKNLLITGGSGTVGQAFIRENIDKYNFYSYARNEKLQVALKRNFPEVEIIFGSVEKKTELLNAIRKAKPEIIIHAAALKHVDTAEKQPSLAIKTNILGSLNVVESAILEEVPLTVGISTDKACSPDNLYGKTKYFMERIFHEHNNEKNRFICCRFGNVAWSNGSVIPFWMNLARENKPLPITSEDMTRLIFSGSEASKLIGESLKIVKKEKRSFILSKRMKKVNMLKMAKLISSSIKIIGLRSGEVLSEDLISKEEIKFTKVLDNEYLLITPDKEVKLSDQLKVPLSSSNAEEMSEKEMMDLIHGVQDIGSRSSLEQKEY